MRRMPGEPEWTKHMPDNACLNSCEILEMFGYKSTRSNIGNVRHYVEKGNIPEPSFKNKGWTHKLMWRLSDVRKFKADKNKSK